MVGIASRPCLRRVCRTRGRPTRLRLSAVVAIWQLTNYAMGDNRFYRCHSRASEPRILADAGVAEPPILGGFHIGALPQHLKRIASALSADDPTRVAAKAVIVAEVERLHWRGWNGKAKNARISIDRIRMVMHHFQGEPGSQKSITPAQKLSTCLAGAGWLSGGPVRLAGELPRTPPRGLARRHCAQ
jgi:hypothetical protein